MQKLTVVKGNDIKIKPRMLLLYLKNGKYKIALCSTPQTLANAHYLTAVQ